MSTVKCSVRKGFKGLGIITYVFPVSPELSLGSVSSKVCR
jgi:hypothetical protein